MNHDFEETFDATEPRLGRSGGGGKSTATMAPKPSAPPPQYNSGGGGGGDGCLMGCMLIIGIGITLLCGLIFLVSVLGR